MMPLPLAIFALVPYGIVRALRALVGFDPVEAHVAWRSDPASPPVASPRPGRFHDDHRNHDDEPDRHDHTVASALASRHLQQREQTVAPVPALRSARRERLDERTEDQPRKRRDEPKPQSEPHADDWSFRRGPADSIV